MLVRQLQGVHIGEVQEMPYAVAQRLLDSGAVCKYGHEPKVRGMVLHPAPGEPEPEPTEPGEPGPQELPIGCQLAAKKDHRRGKRGRK